jgi:hypothetical protein
MRWVRRVPARPLSGPGHNGLGQRTAQHAARQACAYQCTLTGSTIFNAKLTSTLWDCHREWPAPEDARSIALEPAVSAEPWMGCGVGDAVDDGPDPVDELSASAAGQGLVVPPLTLQETSKFGGRLVCRGVPLTESPASCHPDVGDLRRRHRRSRWKRCDQLDLEMSCRKDATAG